MSKSINFTNEELKAIYDRIKIEKEWGASVYPEEYLSLFDSILKKIDESEEFEKYDLDMRTVSIPCSLEFSFDERDLGEKLSDKELIKMAKETYFNTPDNEIKDFLSADLKEDNWKIK